MSESAGTKTTCPYCGVGCGVLVVPSPDGKAAEVRGDPDHPANYGKLCSKGSALGETLALEDRLLFPKINNQHASWPMALDLLASKFSAAIKEHGPDSVAMYVSGQILTEDYYVANKLMKGFIGTANIDTNSRLCMASSVAGHKRAFGTDTVPGTYEDLELAELVVLVGSNLAWCHPVLYQRLVAARKKNGTKVVIIDPRATATTEIADLHLPIAPGTDVALFNGLLSYLSAKGCVDHAYVTEYTSGFAETIKSAGKMDLAEIAPTTGLKAADIETLYAWFAETEKVVTVYSQGVNQSTAGTDKVNAITNCHLATGRIGKPGMGPFSVTGQPNAMGGREVGGLANMLAAHMELANPEHRKIVQTFWGSPTVADTPGHKAVDLFDAVADGKIKALWIMATNPVDSLPEADRVKQAIANCDFVAVSDVTRHTDTTALADVLLPASAWGEKDGTVTNSERQISRQRAFLSAPGETKPDWWQVCEIGKRLGYSDAFSYSGPKEIFAEYAALTGVDNNGTRDLDISAYEAITQAEYDELEPFQWPQPKGAPKQTTRFFANGNFYTPSRRGNFIPVALRMPAVKCTPEYPLVLNTGRIRDQWHTMTRTAKTQRLMSHIAEPFLEIHPDDAQDVGLKIGDIAAVTSPHGSVLLRAVVTDRQRKGSVFAPFHWTDQYASNARVDKLVASRTDPVSGQPESKFTPASVSRFNAGWYGFAISLTPLSAHGADYFATAPAHTGFRAEFAGLEAPDDWDDLAESLLFDEDASSDERLSYRDARSGHFRFARIRDGRLQSALFVAPTPVEVSRTWGISRLGEEIQSADRLRLLAGRPGADMPDKGAIVCSCFEVGVNEITDAVIKEGCATVDAVGACLKAGTNCGSCRSEIARIIDATSVSKAG